MGTEPLVSIVTVTRNRAVLLPRAIESIQKQTYSNYEHIIIDGASTDKTREVVLSYNDPKIRYIRLEKNLSVIKCRAIGAEVSKGEYLTSLDDDDEYLSTKIEKQVSLIESLSNEYGFVYCWMAYYDESTKRKVRIHNPEFRGMVADDVVESPKVSGTPTFLVRRSVYFESGGYIDNIGIASDWEFAARLCQKWLIDYVPEVLVNVYVNHGRRRMSDNGYYKDIYKRRIQFHSHFLNEFQDIFTRYPERGLYHFQQLAQSYFYLNNWSKGFKFYFRCLKFSLKFRDIFLPVIIISKKIVKKKVA